MNGLIMSNRIYIATSLDGFIADKNGAIDWLSMVPITEEVQSEFTNFMDTIDALVMGRNTFEIVKGFGGEWPYNKKVFVVSNSMNSIPSGYEDKTELIKGTPTEIVEQLHKRGYENLYIDGGKTIQNFLKEDLIDDMIISAIPILLGDGKPLFGELSNPQKFKLVDTKVISNLMVQTHYRKI